MNIGMYYPFMYLSQTLVSIYTILSPYRRACVVFSVIDQLKRAKSIFIYTVYSSSEYTTATILNRMNASKNIHNLCIKLSRLYWMQQYTYVWDMCVHKDQTYTVASALFVTSSVWDYFWDIGTDCPHSISKTVGYKDYCTLLYFTAFD